MQTKLITLDFWNTIGIPNPAFADARTELLSLYGITREDYKNTKKYIDENLAINLQRAVEPTDAVRYLFNNSGKLVSEEVVEQVSHSIQTLARLYQPTVNTPELEEAITFAKSKGVALGIISNTNFVDDSSILHSILEQTNDWFDFGIFSGKVNLVKPDVNIFNLAILDYLDLRNELIKPENVLHIGDNPICDTQGATAAGFRAFTVDKGSHSQILEIIKNELS